MILVGHSKEEMHRRMDFIEPTLIASEIEAPS